MGIKHTYVSAVVDVNDPNKVRPSNWNADHTIDGDVDFNGFDITNAGNFGSSAGAFTALSDVPNSYAGSAGKVPAVNAGETGLEFVIGGTSGDSVLDWVTPQQFGAVADGSSHPLSAFYGSLAAAQAAYDGAFYFVTSLTQQIDWAACKAASNEAFGSDLDEPDGDGILGGGNEGDYLQVGANTDLEAVTSFRINDGEPDLIPNALVSQVAFVTYFSSPGFIATSQVASNTARVVTCVSNITLADDSMYAFGTGGEHGSTLSYLNKAIYLPAGNYKFGADTWTIRNLASGVIRGAGRLATTLYADEIVLQFDGIWYSHLYDFGLRLTGSGGTTALDIDGNVPGQPYTTRGVQGCTFDNLFAYAAGSPAAVSMCRQGSSSGQGSECIFLNCHFQGAIFACYEQYGFNALANTIMGGNFQDYTKHGAYAVGGTFSVFNTGFQTTHIALQQANSGYDIQVGDSGSFEYCEILGCRTEGIRFLDSGAVSCAVSGIISRPALGAWFANQAKTVGDMILESGGNTTWICTQSGTTHATTEPTWVYDAKLQGEGSLGTEKTDGTVKWKEIIYYFINNSGSVDWDTVNPGTASALMQSKAENPQSAKTSDYAIPDIRVRDIPVNTTGGAVKITLPTRTQHGCKILIKKTSADSNPVNIFLPQDGSELEGISQGNWGAAIPMEVIVDPGGWREFWWSIASSWSVSGTSNPPYASGDRAFAINTQTANYTLTGRDLGRVVAMNKVSSGTVTIPTNASVPFPVGTRISVTNLTANTTTITPDGGVTINSLGGLTNISGQYGRVELLKRATDTWLLSGNLA